jgi:hypothetical protein
MTLLESVYKGFDFYYIPNQRVSINRVDGIKVIYTGKVNEVELFIGKLVIHVTFHFGQPKITLIKLPTPDFFSNETDYLFFPSYDLFMEKCAYDIIIAIGSWPFDDLEGK